MKECVVRSLGSFEGDDVSAKTDFASPSGDRGGHPIVGARVKYCAKTPMIALRSTRILMMDGIIGQLNNLGGLTSGSVMIVLVIEITIQINARRIPSLVHSSSPLTDIRENHTLVGVQAVESSQSPIRRKDDSSLICHSVCRPPCPCLRPFSSTPIPW